MIDRLIRSVGSRMAIDEGAITSLDMDSIIISCTYMLNDKAYIVTASKKVTMILSLCFKAFTTKLFDITTYF